MGSIPSLTHDLWLVLHLVAFAVGTGTALFSDVLFARALRRPQVGGWRSEVLASGSTLIWGGLVFVVVSGIALTLPRAGELLASGRFVTKMVVVTVIVINGLHLDRVLMPRITEAFFRVGDTSTGSALLPALRRRAFVAGAVSSSSWLSAVALGGLPDLPNGFVIYPLGYLGVLATAVTAALLADLLYARTLTRASAAATKAVAQQLLDEVSLHSTWFSRPRN